MDEREKEIFEEKYGNIENFSRRAVGSLFSGEEEPADLGAPPYKRAGRQSDPEAEYEAYLNSASEANRRQQEKERNEKEAAIRHREAQLDELNRLSRKSRERDADEELVERTEVSQIAVKPAAARPSVNIRNLAVLGLFAVLAISAVLTWQLVAANSRLNDANEQVAALLAAQSELNYDYANIVAEVERLEADLQHYRNLALAPPIYTPENGEDGEEDGGENGADDGAVAGGARTHVVQQGETLWGILVEHNVNVARLQEVIALNNIQNPDHVPAGTVLTIPD
ncbi:MAG: LysM peptidoglycan-binding domain-containing protein [Clostridiales bacterium]|nr:LysM peptidoglycan-binding domain-containing protein [Clostridiales bacterium]